MALQEEMLPPGWQDLDRQMGQLFMMGFDGTSVTPQVRSLIEDYHIGSILLSAKNLKSAEEATQLIFDLQIVARNAGHSVPLLIALDQENGGVNSLYDEIYIRQFPSSLGIAATGSKPLAHEVAFATGQELKAVGVNWILGPVLDVLTNIRNQPLGVRTFGDDPHEVSQYGVAFLKGLQAAGLVTCGKHFPSYGNLEFLGSQADVPVITESLEQLRLSALVPFRNAILQGLDAMIVGGVSIASAGLNAMHACLSDEVVDNLLRRDLQFNGVAVSDCLEMEALTHNIGVGGGAVMAKNAGCDIMLSCRSFQVQQEAINGLKLGVENGIISQAAIGQSLRRVLQMKLKCTSWEQALNPPGLVSLSQMQPSHSSLSTRAYNNSVTVVRDKNNLLPLPSVLEPDEEILLLTPLVKPLAASAVSRSVSENFISNNNNNNSNTTLTTTTTTTTPDFTPWDRTASVMSAESVFREFGRSLSRQRNSHVLHTSYTANGLRPIHESLIDRANAVIVVTADANRNLYQYGLTKHVSMICKSQVSRSDSGERCEKPMIVVSVSSPYDFATDPSIGTYVCTYDFTETALQALVKVLYGELAPAGTLPGTVSRSQKLSHSRQHWLVESWNEERDADGLEALLDAVRKDSAAQGQLSELVGVRSGTFSLRRWDIDEAHFVVRNSSTHALYGFCSTYFFRSTGTGVIGSLIVDPTRRKLSIGRSLHNRAIRRLLQVQGMKRCQLGSRLPGIYLGIPGANPVERKKLRQWFANLGWNTAVSRPVCSAVLHNLTTWTPPYRLSSRLENQDSNEKNGNDMNNDTIITTTPTTTTTTTTTTTNHKYNNDNMNTDMDTDTDVMYDMIYGWDYAETILEHIQTNTKTQANTQRQGVIDIYKMALDGAPDSAVIRAKRASDGAVMGSVVVYNERSILGEYMPVLAMGGGGGGGISSPVILGILGEYDKGTLVQGLIVLGIKQIRKQGAESVVLDCVDGNGSFDNLSDMGFKVVHNFEEVDSDVATWTWTMVPQA